MTCEVGVARSARSARGGGAVWEAVRDALARGSRRRTTCCRRAWPSRRALVPWSDAARAYAAPSFVAGRDWLEAVTDLMHRIHAEFEFDRSRRR